MKKIPPRRVCLGAYRYGRYQFRGYELLIEHRPQGSTNKAKEKVDGRQAFSSAQR